MTRRTFLGIAACAAFRDEALDLVERLISRSPGAPNDEDFWAQIRQGFVLDPNLVNLNNGGVCPSPRTVQDSLRRQLEYANQAPSYFMWRQQEPMIEQVRARLARMFGCESDEIAITRNASEALETLLLGMPLNPGDEILTTDMDYPRMITTIQQRVLRDGVKMVQISQPAKPKSQRELLQRFESAITARTKLILVSQVSFLNGQIYPVREICTLGASKSIPVVVDGAHAFAQFPFVRDQLQCDFYGCSLHKWLMAPIGTGFLYIRKSKIGSVWPLMAAGAEQSTNIRKFEEIGTHPAANHNAIGEAITFNEMIGLDRKAARLRYLRKLWTDKLSEEKNILYHTRLEPEHSCALTTVEIDGIEPEKLAGWLLEKHGIFVTTINQPTFKGIRVSANVYTSTEEIGRFASAMLTACRQGIG